LINFKQQVIIENDSELNLIFTNSYVINIVVSVTMMLHCFREASILAPNITFINAIIFISNYLKNIIMIY